MLQLGKSVGRIAKLCRYLKFNSEFYMAKIVLRLISEKHSLHVKRGLPLFFPHTNQEQSPPS